MTKRGNNKNLPDRIPVVSLFCGAGGLDAGFASAGFRTIYAADSMKQAVNSFNANIGENVAVVLDLLKATSGEVVDVMLNRAAEVGVMPRGLLGGPPCQGVSNANNQSGPDDPRNRLFSRYANIVLRLEAEVGLEFFVFENVPALVEAKKNRPLYDKLRSRLRKKYDLYTAILDASRFGVPQVRRRLIVVGLNKQLKEKKFLFPSGSDVPSMSVRGAIEGLPEPVFFRRGLDPKGFAHHPNHWAMVPKSKKFSPSYVQSKDGRSFIRLEWDKQSRTVAYGNREMHVHPNGNRRISVYEAMRLQGFPNEFEIFGNFSEQVTQVSNAVPPPLARAVAESVVRVLNGANHDE